MGPALVVRLSAPSATRSRVRAPSCVARTLTALETRARLLPAFTMNRFYLKQGDTARSLSCVLEDNTGAAQDLTGATVTFSMREKETQAVKVDALAATVVTAGTGLVRYDWAADDVDTPGTYEGEFRVTLSSGKQISFPSGQAPLDYLLIIVQDTV
jgi:hypothetical protein